MSQEKFETLWLRENESFIGTLVGKDHDEQNTYYIFRDTKKKRVYLKGHFHLKKCLCSKKIGDVLKITNLGKRTLFNGHSAYFYNVEKIATENVQLSLLDVNKCIGI